MENICALMVNVAPDSAIVGILQNIAIGIWVVKTSMVLVMEFQLTFPYLQMEHVELESIFALMVTVVHSMGIVEALSSIAQRIRVVRNCMGCAINEI